jgi:hypothetical protein
MSPTHRSLPYNRSCQLRSGSHSTTPLNPFRRAGFAHLTRGISRAATAACTEGEGASEGGTHSVEVESFLRAAFSPPFTQFYARAPHCRMQSSCAVPHPADARHRALVVRWCPPFQRKISSKFGISERRVPTQQRRLQQGAPHSSLGMYLESTQHASMQTGVLYLFAGARATPRPSPWSHQRH